MTHLLDQILVTVGTESGSVICQITLLNQKISFSEGSCKALISKVNESIEQDGFVMFDWDGKLYQIQVIVDYPSTNLFAICLEKIAKEVVRDLEIKRSKGIDAVNKIDRELVKELTALHTENILENHDERIQTKLSSTICSQQAGCERSKYGHRV